MLPIQSMPLNVDQRIEERMGMLTRLLALFAATTSTVAAAEVPPFSRMHTITVGRAQLDVPSDFKWKTESKGVLVGQLPDSYDVMMSLSLLTVEKDGELVDGAGAQIALRSALASKAKLQRNGAWYRSSGPPSNPKQGAIVHDWYFGVGAHTAVITCVIDVNATDSEQGRAILATVPKMIQSFRTAP